MGAEYADMLNISDYEHYLATHETPYDRMGCQGLHLQMYINDAGRDLIIRHIAQKVSLRWLDILIGNIEDKLLDGEDRRLIQTGRILFRPISPVGIEIEIEVHHVSVRVVSEPPINSVAVDEIKSQYEAQEIAEDTFRFELEEEINAAHTEDEEFRNMFADFQPNESDDDSSGRP
jgi:hypothetical protein